MPLPGLVIRAMEAHDAEALNAIANLPRVQNGTTLGPFVTLASTREWLAKPGEDLRIVAALDGVVVGSADLRRFGEKSAHVAELGIAVHDDHAGHGVGAALLEALIEAADNWLGLRRLQLRVFPDNARAIRLYERLGFVREGVLRGYAFKHGRDRDIVLMARLRSDAQATMRPSTG